MSCHKPHAMFAAGHIEPAPLAIGDRVVVEAFRGSVDAKVIGFWNLGGSGGPVVRTDTGREFPCAPHSVKRVRRPDPTRNPLDCRNVIDDAADMMARASTPEQLDRAERAVTRAIDIEDLNREHCQ